MRDVGLGLWLSAFLFIAVIVVILLIITYNRLVGLRQNCKQGAADIDAGMRQRHDLVPNSSPRSKAMRRTSRARSTR